ncbi:MAG: cytochrome [Nevskia sp.]|nr:cytochrome [Nevskia sp.]
MEDAKDYGAVAKLAHWLVFALVAVQFAVAWTMPEIGRDTRPEGLVAWHLSVGTLILLVVVLRLLWRLTHPAPPQLPTVPRWQRSLAGLVHFLLYAILLALPFLGWGNASSRGWDVALFGLIPLPTLFADGSRFGHALGDIHAACATVLLILVGLHCAAALYHQLIAKDRTLRRMLPWSTRS